MTGPTLKIRIADAIDLPAMLALYHATGSRPPGYAEQCLGEQQDGKRLILIAAEQGVDAGIAMFNRRPLYAPFRRLGIPEIQDIAVIPAFRRQGIATSLIAFAEAKAKEEKCEIIGMSVGVGSDFGAAQRLYAKLGYLPDGGGVTYDRQPVQPGDIRPVDGNLCLMLVKEI